MQAGMHALHLPHVSDGNLFSLLNLLCNDRLGRPLLDALLEHQMYKNLQRKAECPELHAEVWRFTFCCAW